MHSATMRRFSSSRSHSPVSRALVFALCMLSLGSCATVEAQEYQLVPFEYEERFGFFDEDSRDVVIAPKFDRVFHRDTAGVVYGRVETDRWQVIGRDGGTLLNLDYTSVAPRIAGLFSGSGPSPQDFSGPGRSHLINYDGDIVISDVSAHQAWDGVVVIKYRDTGFTPINSEAEEIFDNQYFFAAEPFSEGYARVQYSAREYAFLDRDGNPVFETDELFINGPVSEGLALAAESRERIGYIDITGEFQFVVPGMRTGSEFYNGRAAIEMFDGSFRIIDKTGETVHQFGPEVTFIAVQGFQSGYLLITRGGPGAREYAFVDPEGKQLGPSFLEAESFHHGWARVTTEDGPGVFSAEGELILSSELMEGR